MQAHTIDDPYNIGYGSEVLSAGTAGSNPIADATADLGSQESGGLGGLLSGLLGGGGVSNLLGTGAGALLAHRLTDALVTLVKGL